MKSPQSAAFCCGEPLPKSSPEESAGRKSCLSDATTHGHRRGFCLSRGGVTSSVLAVPAPRPAGGQGDLAAQIGLHQSSRLPKVIFRRGTVLVARKSQRQSLSGSSHSSAEGRLAPIGRMRVFWKATN